MCRLQQHKLKIGSFKLPIVGLAFFTLYPPAIWVLRSYNGIQAFSQSPQIPESSVHRAMVA
jgi:hypothetical protein